MPDFELRTPEHEAGLPLDVRSELWLIPESEPNLTASWLRKSARYGNETLFFENFRRSTTMNSNSSKFHELPELH
jgi:hypothetical protein